jgi:filamentous hemagglutinin family protein
LINALNSVILKSVGNTRDKLYPYHPKIMYAIVRSLLCVGSGLVGFTLAMGTLQAQQVVPDGSINTIVNSINGRDFVITGGGKTGGNLFHSFSEFSVQTGGSVAFNNAMDVQNIFTRVTGSNVSSIDGVIRADGRANLFLLNPNGILFGPNAALNIGGSFLGTTASRIKFADASEFNALNTPPLLTMTVPVGLQMGQNSGAIQVTGTGHKLALVAAGLLPIDRSQSPMGLQVSPRATSLSRDSPRILLPFHRGHVKWEEDSVPLYVGSLAQ